jgi:streptomycin 6-kinase
MTSLHPYPVLARSYQEPDLEIFEDLAERLTAYSRQWNIEFSGKEIETPSSTIAFGVLQKNRTPVVLKLLKPRSDEHKAWRWLEYHAGQGAVSMLARDEGATLLEQLSPGTELVELVRAGQDEEATRQVCRTIELLCGGPEESWVIPEGFKTVEDWGQAFERNSRDILTAKIPTELLDLAQSLYGELCESQGPRRLLHGDLHHYNVLLDATHGWQAIDPKGVVGEMAYETGAMLRNPVEMPEFYTNPRTLKNRVEIICQRLGLEEKRVLGWCFAQAILSAIWSIEDGGSKAEIERTLGLAETSLNLLQSL